MSDEPRDDENGYEDYNAQREGESEGEWLRRVTSPELRMLDLFERLNARVEKSEEETKHRDERVQGRIELILQHQAEYQARAEVDMQNLRESQARTDAVVQRFANATLRRFEIVEGEVSNLDRKIEALVDAQIRSEDEMKELREAQKSTDERLNAFINTVERLISERRNGGGKGGVLDE